MGVTLTEYLLAEDKHQDDLRKRFPQYASGLVKLLDSSMLLPYQMEALRRTDGMDEMLNRITVLDATRHFCMADPHWEPAFAQVQAVLGPVRRWPIEKLAAWIGQLEYLDTLEDLDPETMVAQAEDFLVRWPDEGD